MVKSFIDKITGKAATDKMNELNARASKLPKGYQDAWIEIQAHLWQTWNAHSEIKLLETFENVMEFFEESAYEGLAIEDILDNNVASFANELKGEGKDYRDKWREQLNKNVARKLAKLKEEK